MDTKLMMVSFDEHLVRHGLKSTRQRSVIAQCFFEQGGHLTLGQVHDAVRAVDASIGYATVYRTMKLLLSADLAAEHRFDDSDQAMYEVSGLREHHDHLICMDCGRIVEYEEPEIERLQEVLAQGLGFKVVAHRHELYGQCQTQDCIHRESGAQGLRS
jgi:Fur family ferric uptake transcriptional regulator